MSQHSTLSLSTKDVIHIEGFQENASLFKNESTLRIRTILQQLQTACTDSGMGLSEVNALMQQGIPCEVLQPGAADWQVGRIRLSLEFQLGTAVSTTVSTVAPIASTVALQSNSVVAAPMSAPISTVAPAIGLENLEMPEAVEMPEIADDFAFDSEDLGSTDLDLGLDPTNFGVTDLDAGLMDDFMESGLDDSLGADLNTNLNSDLGMDQNLEIGMMDDLDDAFGENLDLGELSLGELGEFHELSEMMPDASLEKSVNVSLDLSDFSDMDGLGDGLTDDLSFDLDSQAVGAADLNALDNPWDLNNDLDEMLLKNGVL